MSDQQGGPEADADAQKATADPRELYRRWRQLVKAQCAADAKVLEVICHREASDEQILTVVRARRQSYDALNDMRPSLQKLLRAKGKWDLAERIDDDWNRLRSPELPPLPSKYSAPSL